jgi:hypothetical protein
MARTASANRNDAATPHSNLARFFRNPVTGRLAIVQMPNTPLAIFLGATLARLAFHPHGAVGTAVSVVAGVAILWWSALEITRGDSVFRRVLGGVVMLGFALGLVMR